MKLLLENKNDTAAQYLKKCTTFHFPIQFHPDTTSDCGTFILTS